MLVATLLEDGDDRFLPLWLARPALGGGAVQLGQMRAAQMVGEVRGGKAQ